MWCVIVREDGSFRFATRQVTDPYLGSVVVANFGEWERIDPDAAAQFLERSTAERDRQVQLAFNAATGLGTSATIRRSMADAMSRYGGSSCLSHAARSATRRAAH